MSSDDDLLALCTAATPGPWWLDSAFILCNDGAIAERGSHHNEALDAAFIAAFSPDVVAGLIRRAQDAEKSAVDEFSDAMAVGTDLVDTQLERDRLRTRLAAVEKERDELLTERNRAYMEKSIEVNAVIKQRDALREGVKALADEWDRLAQEALNETHKSPSAKQWATDRADEYRRFGDDLRALLAPVEGTDEEGGK